MKRSIIVSAWAGLAVLTAGLSLSSCQKEEPSVVHSGKELQVEVIIEGATPSAPVGRQSRAVVSDDTWKSGSTFGLWVVPYKVTGLNGVGDQAGTLRTVGNYADNIKHTYAGTGNNFTVSSAIYYPSSDGKVDLYAVSPQATYTNNTLPSTTAYPHSILADQTATDASGVIASDLLTGQGSGSVAAGAKLSFRHRMSKALIAFKVPAKYKNENVLSVKQVELCGVPLNTTVNLIDSTADPIPTGTLTPFDVKAYQAEKPASTVDGKYVYEAIVVPGSVITSGSSLVRITIEVENLGDVEFNCKLTGANHTFASKKQTSISVTIEDQTEITLSPTQVVIAPWSATANISGSTSKLSKMWFEYTDEWALWPDAKTCDMATLVIEGDTFQATKVEYITGATNLYLIEYDHGTNAGGCLEQITIKTKVGGTVLFNNVSLKNLNGGGPRGYQIKGDPTLNSYNLRIGKITVTGNGVATIAPIQ